MIDAVSWLLPQEPRLREPLPVHWDRFPGLPEAWYAIDEPAGEYYGGKVAAPVAA